MTALLHTVRFRLEHRWAPRHMSDYLDGELAASRRRRVERHVQECEQCRRLLAGLRRIVQTLHAMPAPPTAVDTDADAAAIAAAVRARLTPSA